LNGETGEAMSEHVLVSDEGAVRTIRMNRPEKKNALTLTMYAAITQALREAEGHDAIRCVIIAGASGVFTAGNDIADFMQASEHGWARPALDFLQALARGEKPLVAAVNGIAVGIGTTMLFHCDHVVAADDATISTPFLKLGLIPEAASTLLAPLSMGYTRAFSLLAMGRPLSAAQAREAGIVNTVVEAAAVDAAAMQAAQEIAALPPAIVRVTRRLMRRQFHDAVLDRLEAEGRNFTELLQSDEARAAFAAFFARKK
jgi:enoyl-CoA hydratase/carnithine racemase